MVELIESLPSKFSPLTGRKNSRYVSRIRKRGGGPYRDVMWIGMAHKKFTDPRDGVQFQFGLQRDRLAFEGIWIGAWALRSRRDAQRSLIGQKRLFLSRLKHLPERCYLELYDEEKLFRKAAKDVHENDVDEFLSMMGKRDVHVSLSKEMSARKAISLKGRIVHDIVQTFDKLFDIYMLMINEPTTEVSIKVPSTKEFIERRVLTDEELIHRTMNILKNIGSKPARMPKYVPGTRRPYPVERVALPLNLDRKREVDGCVVYIDDKYNDEDLRKRRKLLVKFRILIHVILNSLRMNTDCALFLLKNPSTDARYISYKDTQTGRILFNLIRFEKNKSIYFWLFATAREIAYMVHKQLGYKHLNLMRDVITAALRRMRAGLP